MRIRALIAIALLAALPAWAITKCVGADGRVSFFYRATGIASGGAVVKVAWRLKPPPAGLCYSALTGLPHR